MNKPLLFIDVDGVLNREVSNSQAHKRGLLSINVTASSSGWKYKLHLDRADTDRLLSLTDVFDLAWGTTWEHDANTLIAPQLGLPTDLPVAVVEPGDQISKAPGIARLADGLPFVWLDDHVDSFDRGLLVDYPASWLVIDVDDVTGLTDDHIGQARAWATTLHGAH